MFKRSASLAILVLAAVAFVALPASQAIGATPMPSAPSRTCTLDDCELYFAQPVECTVCIYEVPEQNLWDSATSRMIDFCECALNQIPWEPMYDAVKDNLGEIFNILAELF